MFAKLLAIILTCGIASGSLLVIRQQRIETAHDISAAHQRLVQHQSKLWSLRSQVALRCQPGEIRAMIDELDLTWKPIPDAVAIEQPIEPSFADRPR